MLICIVAFDGVDVLDVGGPYEVFLTANRLAERAGDGPPFEVVIASLHGDSVMAYGGLGLVPHTSVDRVARVDLVLIPGAIAIEEVASDVALMQTIAELAARSTVTTSVCTGAFLLADAGLLEGREWTTHWEDVELLGRRIGSTKGRRARWIDTGDVVTAGGLSSGIAMALHLVDRYVGRDLAEATARQIDYEWDAERP